MLCVPDNHFVGRCLSWWRRPWYRALSRQTSFPCSCRARSPTLGRRCAGSDTDPCACHTWPMPCNGGLPACCRNPSTISTAYGNIYIRGPSFGDSDRGRTETGCLTQQVNKCWCDSVPKYTNRKIRKTCILLISYREIIFFKDMPMAYHCLCLVRKLAPVCMILVWFWTLV
jgi:hypothetical protein